jgi:tRNA pseudouridine38-40 synthase
MLVAAYDGRDFAGYQAQKSGVRTVEGVLNQTLSEMTGEEITVTGASRTDAGVHAMGQVASFHTDADIPPEEVLTALRQYLPADIGVMRVEYAPPRFHARLSAVSKTYRYRVWNAEEPCVFERRWVYVFPDALEPERMQLAAQKLLGTHDFRAF